METYFKTKRSKVRIRLALSLYRNLVILRETRSTIYCRSVWLKNDEEHASNRDRNLQQNHLDFEAFKVATNTTHL
jgi:hypothetical protein